MSAEPSHSRVLSHMGTLDSLEFQYCFWKILEIAGNSDYGFQKNRVISEAGLKSKPEPEEEHSPKKVKKFANLK